MITIKFSQSDINALHKGRFDHPDKQVRRKMEVLYLKSQRVSHGLICKLMRISENTLLAYLRDFIDNGVENLTGRNGYRPQSELEAYTDEIKTEFETNPPSTINEAIDRIEKLTGLKRKPTQVRHFLRSIGMRLLKVGMVPAKADPEKQAEFKSNQLEPILEDAKSGKRNVFFVDAAHFVHSAFLGLVWCFKKVFVKSPSGRSRFNVLGAFNAVTQRLITVTNTTYINAVSVCQLLRAIANETTNGLPITLILDNAKYQKCALVQELAESLNIDLLYLPSYSPNLNLIERLWKFVKKKCLYSKYYEKFSEFKQAILACISQQSLNRKKDELKSLMTLNFQVFEKAQFQAA